MLKALGAHLTAHKDALYALAADTGATKRDNFFDIDGGIGTASVLAATPAPGDVDATVVEAHGARVPVFVSADRTRACDIGCWRWSETAAAAARRACAATIPSSCTIM